MPGEDISRPVVVDPWPSRGIEVAFEASVAERGLLAERFGLVALHRFVGHARLEREGGSGTIRLCARLEADVVQPCVVSLEDVAATVSDTFACRFARPGGIDFEAGSWETGSWDDDIEPLEGAELNLGEIFAQQLSVALDPYPRAENADTLVCEGLGPNIAFGEDEPEGALARAMVAGDAAAAPGSPLRQGRG